MGGHGGLTGWVAGSEREKRIKNEKWLSSSEADCSYSDGVRVKAVNCLPEFQLYLLVGGRVLEMEILAPFSDFTLLHCQPCTCTYTQS